MSLDDKSNRKRVLLLGGAGARSGVPTHIAMLSNSLAADYDLEIWAAGFDGGYANAHQVASTRQLAGLETNFAPISLVVALCAICRALRSSRYNLVWAHSRMAVLLLRLAVLLTGSSMPTCVTFHGIPFGQGRRRHIHHISVLIERLLARVGHSCLYVFLTGDDRENYLRITRASAERWAGSIVCGNTAHLGPLGPLQEQSHDRRRPLITVVARASAQKNLPDAAAILRNLPPKFDLAFCGLGTNSKGFKRRILNIAGPEHFSRIKFRGEIANVARQLERSDFFLLTSRYEGQSIAAIEAMYCGLPMALPAIESSREIAEAHPYCTLIDPEAHQASAAQIEALYEKFQAAKEAGSDPAARIGAATRRHFDFQDWCAAQRRIIEICLLARVTRLGRDRIRG